ncbi:tau 95 subunit of transcription factor TFIIIC [Podila epigama]|nr:tau 95 subunit of transcription factor TFIIIC [Podila epigama]
MDNVKSQPWPEEKLFSIELPAHVQSIERVIDALGGERAISNAYLGGASLDLRFRYQDPFSTPIQGQTVDTNNILMKVTKRYRVKRKAGTSKRTLPPFRAPTEDDEPLDEEEQPQIHTEFIGAITKTVRFPGLADYQHIVDPNDEIYKLKSDLKNMNYENFVSVKIDNRSVDEDYNTLQIIPPVYISKLNVPLPYKFRHSRQSEPEPEPEASKKGKGKQKAGKSEDPVQGTNDTAAASETNDHDM